MKEIVGLLFLILAVSYMFLKQAILSDFNISRIVVNNGIRHKTVLTKQYFQDKTKTVHKKYFSWFNVKALESEKIGIECLGIFVNENHFTKPDFNKIFDFYSKDKINAKKNRLSLYFI